MQPHNAAWVALVCLTAATGAHTAFTARQLSPDGHKASEYGLERYIAFFQAPLGWLLVHTAAISVLLRKVSSRTGNMGPALHLRAVHIMLATLSIVSVLFMHGASTVWPLGFVILGKLILGRLPERATGHATVWAYAALAILLNHAFQGGIWDYVVLRVTGVGSSNIPMAVATAFRSTSGFAPKPFRVTITFRYTVLRFISYAIDSLTGKLACGSMGRPRHGHGEHMQPHTVDGTSFRIEALIGNSVAVNTALCHPAMLEEPPSATVTALGASGSSWAAFFSYMFFAPLYLAGPIITAHDFMHQIAALATAVDTAGESSRSSSSSSRILVVQAKRASSRCLGSVIQLAVLLAWVVAVELARRSCYIPETLLPHYASLWPWQLWFCIMCVLGALWVQSYVPWAVARLCASCLKVATVDETPVSFVTASVSARQFWRQFHASWHRWLVQYVYAPLGGGASGAAAVMLVSTLLHSFRTPWLIWGALNFMMLVAEKVLKEKRNAERLSKLPEALRGGINQTIGLSSMVALFPLPSWRLLLWFGGVSLPMCMLNSVWLRARHNDGLHKARPSWS